MADDNSTLTPTFIVYINGTRLGVDHEAAVRQILVKDQLDSPSTCRIVLSDMDRKWSGCSDFDLAQSVSVLLGYKDAVEEVFYGEITGSEVILKKQADATFVLTCSGKLQHMFKVKKHRVFNEMTDEDILGEIASEYGLSTDFDALSAEHIVKVQENMTDYDLIRQTASAYNYRLYVRDECLYLKETPEGSEDVVLEWGKTLLDFQAVMNTDKLFTRVEYVGWDNMTGEGFSGLVTPAEVTAKTGNGPLGLQLAEDNFEPRPLVMRDNNLSDQQQAEERSLAVLTAQSHDFMTARAVCEGDNRILSGTVVEIKETGARYCGPWLVRSVSHDFHASFGYSTRCSLQRNCTS